MGNLLELYDETRMRFIEILSKRWDNARLSDSEFKAIEVELIRFADEFAVAN